MRRMMLIALGAVMVIAMFAIALTTPEELSRVLAVTSIAGAMLFGLIAIYKTSTWLTRHTKNRRN